MDRYVADPHWGGYITWYFYLGGIAAGSYALAALANLFGGEEDRRATRVALALAHCRRGPIRRACFKKC